MIEQMQGLKFLKSLSIMGKLNLQHKKVSEIHTWFSHFILNVLEGDTVN